MTFMYESMQEVLEFINDKSFKNEIYILKNLEFNEKLIDRYTKLGDITDQEIISLQQSIEINTHNVSDIIVFLLIVIFTPNKSKFNHLQLSAFKKSINGIHKACKSVDQLKEINNSFLIVLLYATLRDGNERHIPISCFRIRLLGRINQIKKINNNYK